MLLETDADDFLAVDADFAQQLLNLPADFTGRPLRGVLPAGRLANVVTGAVEGVDLLVVQGDRVLAALTRAGRSIQRDGKPVQDSVQARVLVRESVTVILERRLPILGRVGVL